MLSPSLWVCSLGWLCASQHRNPPWCVCPELPAEGQSHFQALCAYLFRASSVADSRFARLSLGLLLHCHLHKAVGRPHAVQQRNSNRRSAKAKGVHRLSCSWGLGEKWLNFMLLFKPANSQTLCSPGLRSRDHSRPSRRRDC